MCFPFLTQVRNKWQWDVNLYIGTIGGVVTHFPKGNEDLGSSRITNKLINAKYVTVGCGINFTH